ncbi:hypothetical protein MKX03_017404 [Papaver bracteatum]|nr:hypothetical protein MKX03_017404 [Papaver bracteatum]
MDHHTYNQINSSYYPSYTYYSPADCLIAAPATPYPPRPTPSAPPEEFEFSPLAHAGALPHHGGQYYSPTGFVIPNYPPPTAPVHSGIYSTPPTYYGSDMASGVYIHGHYPTYYPPTGCPIEISAAPPAAYPPPHGEPTAPGVKIIHENYPPPPPGDYSGYPIHGDHGDSDVCNGVLLLTNDDVLGDAIPEQQQDSLRRWCDSLLKRRAGTNFPGSHPVSLDWENMQFLWQTDYRVTWKADGTRYLMLINSDGSCYLIDRNFNFRRVQMRFPGFTQENGHDNLTLIDGEMVIDTDPETHEQKRKYLVFDLMAINGKSVIDCPFGERWKMLQEQVLGPRNLYCHRYNLDPFRVEIKKFWLLSETNELLKEFIPRLLHGEDGLIFQGWNDKYVPSAHSRLLKWKPPEKNSVDFLLQLVGSSRTPSLYLYDRGRMRCMYGYGVVFGSGEDPSEFAGKVIECSCPDDENVWRFMRLRTDKTTPNSYQTSLKVMKSIQDNITEGVLLDEIQKIVQSRIRGYS